MQGGLAEGVETPFLPQAGLGRCMHAGSGLACSPLSALQLRVSPTCGFVSLPLFWSLDSLCWLFGSWPNSSWGLYSNC